jgi:hypothetical protein
MANNSSVADLRLDALWRAGEPGDSTSSFWTKSIEYLNRIQQTLLLGGGVAVGRDLATSAGIYAHLVDMPLIDWWWARARGVFNTNVGQLLTATLTQGSTTVTFSANATPSLVDYRVQVAGLSTVPLIAAHTSGTATATLDAAWPEATQTSVAVNVFKLKQSLNTDFLRFAATPYLHANRYGGIAIASSETAFTMYPYSMIPQGIPTRAFMVAPQTVEMNSWDTRAYRFEFEYVAMAADLDVPNTPILPTHHRAVLAVGGAMLMAFDKGDTRSAFLASEYRELVQRMVQEHRQMMGAGSTSFGQIKTRQTEMAVRGTQRLGELYLV